MTIDPDLLDGDLVASARVRVIQALADDQASVAKASPWVGVDGQGDQPPGPYTDWWVFSGFDSEGNPFRNVEGTGLCAIVLLSRGQWATNRHNTARFPVLQVAVYADCSRDGAGNVAARDATLRCNVVAKLLRDTFHDASNGTHDWPNGLRVHSCVLQNDLSVTDVPKGDGVVRGLMTFEVAVD